ncbi:hypothetical protein F5146DRAFT_1195064 [Armillaria mellea]|nr:hypothetical protein F5146DRAFT_1195064 [Armillaria mellea]
MEDHRLDTVKDIKDLPQVSLKFYENYILPPSIYGEHVDEITKALKANRVLKEIHRESGLRWSDFTNDPKDNGDEENETFKYIATIAAAIVKAAQEVLSEGPKPTTVMECEPHEVAILEGRDSGFKSDGHYRLLQSRRPDYVENATSTTPIEPLAWIKSKTSTHKLACDLPALEEYERGDEPKAQNFNFKNLIGNVSQAMYADPTRRFMFGMTIENTTARFWFFSRAIVLVSESFDFMKVIVNLILRVYAYPLPTNTSEHIIHGPLSRATRVWTVCQINDLQYRKRVLKDVWIPAHAKTELEIHQEIFCSIEKHHPEIGTEYRKKYFVEILKCGVVQTSQNGDDDMSVFVRGCLEIVRDRALSTPETARVSRTMPRSTISTPTGGNLTNSHADNGLQPPRLYKGRKHIRVIFADVGTPLSDIRHPRVLFKALSDALEGLHHLYMGRYVHRDISAGNTIVCDGRAKISDLEYAKKFLSPGPVNDAKTRTPIYMAVEVQATEYLFIRNAPVLLPDFNHVSAEHEGHEGEPFAEDEPTAEDDEPPFLHNYLHDIESLFWMGFHALFSTIPATCLQDQLDRRNKQRDLFNAFFPHYLEGSRERRRFFVRGKFLTAKGVLPTEYKHAVQWLLNLRFILAYHYDQVEKFPNFPRHEHFDNVYATDMRNSSLFLAFDATMKAAYNGET